MIFITPNKTTLIHFNKIIFLKKYVLRVIFISHNTQSQIKSGICLHLSLVHTVLIFILHSDCVAEVT
jgi:hypothetical protein